MVRFFSPSNSSRVARPKSPSLSSMFLLRKRLPNFKLYGSECDGVLSMDDPVGVQVAQGSDDLSHVALNFDFGQPLASLDQLIQRLLVK